LVLPPDTILLWHERVYHAGAKSRLTKCHVDGRYGFHLCQEDADKSPSRLRKEKRDYKHKEDVRFFSYVYNEAGKMFRRSADGSVSAGDRLYKRPQLFCKGIDDPDYACPNCEEGEFVVELSDLSRNAYANGQKIIGDIDKYGWAVHRSRYINGAEETEIRNICGKGGWTSICTSSNTRMLKYQLGSKIPKTWKSAGLKEMFKTIKEEIFDKVLPSANYDFGKHNVLKNNGVNNVDQDGHYDYNP